MGEFGETLMRGYRDGIGGDHFFNGRLLETADGRAGKNGVGDASIDIGRTFLFKKSHRFGHRTGGIDLVIKDNAVLAVDIADDIEKLERVKGN